MACSRWPKRTIESSAARINDEAARPARSASNEQMLVRKMGRVISRSDIPQEELARTKVISEDFTIADRLNPIMDDYKKYLR
jgi:hypothetical protein